MKKIGLIGGMGWESTAIYYQKINKMSNRARGGQHAARLHVSSLDFGEAYPMIRDREHANLASLISSDLEFQSNSGCEISLICCNTAHQALPFIRETLRRSVVPIMDTVAHEARAMGYRCVAILGTSSTVHGGLYDRAMDSVGIRCVKAKASEYERIDDIIFKELMFGVVKPASVDYALAIIDRLRAEGAEAVVLGCTELPMLVEPEASSLPILDSVELHCRKAVSMAMEDE